ncbi:hypothetical protein KLP40_14015 [Hymenobacter sp. NST-14]|uniref:DUF6438 domain-containing protein n=1 Tax=Hymenobacter piscis TaxID=2839984 RepID=UPI001C00DDD9|nr:DUF6438 domain-containing protein [Hymenobacter piscis]MBT9394283.1 hypothetical protein [Hymenobacter piscis]
MRAALFPAFVLLLGLSALPACTVNYYVPAATEGGVTYSEPQRYRRPPRGRWQPAPGPVTYAPGQYPPAPQPAPTTPAPGPGRPPYTPPPAPGPGRQPPVPAPGRQPHTPPPVPGPTKQAPVPAPGPTKQPPVPAPPRQTPRTPAPTRVPVPAPQPTPTPTPQPAPAPQQPRHPIPQPAPAPERQPAPEQPRQPVPAPAPEREPVPQPTPKTPPVRLPEPVETPDGPSVPAGQLARPTLIFSRTPCLGKCPSYTARVYADGRVEYEGFRYAPVEGRRQLTMSPAVVQDFLREAEQIGFRQLPDSYSSGASDMPATVLSITTAQGTKQVRVEENAPQPLQHLFALIDKHLLSALNQAGDM